jgi:hypothetical protein
VAGKVNGSERGFIEKNISGGCAWGTVLPNVFILTRGGECCGRLAIFYYVNENVAGDT